MLRRTKIIATLGPATDNMLDRIIQAGVDVVRLNFSHGTFEEHRKRAESVRNRARAHGRQIGVIVDLQGPKIRIECFKDGKIKLKEGDEFALDTAHPSDAGNQHCVGITYKNLPKDVQRGDTLILDDGNIILWVDEVKDTRIICKVRVGGKLSDKKGINRQGGGLSAQALTEKDKQDIKYAAELKADYVALSFPRNANDVRETRRLLRDAGGQGFIIAKIERAEAIATEENLDGIIKASDAIMIARGDLGVEIGDEALPPAQKMIISKARTLNKVVITATQMMDSMIKKQMPTRAEVFDVANAVFDGTDAVMLSAETAMGKYPDKAIETMGRICRRAEKQREVQESDHRINTKFTDVDEAIALSTVYAANHLKVKAIATLTESGSTPLWMSRISSGIPIYALSSRISTRRQVTLYRGVEPVSFDTTLMKITDINQEIIDELLRRSAVRAGDLVIITKGDTVGTRGGTNVMKIVRVGDVSSVI